MATSSTALPRTASAHPRLREALPESASLLLDILRFGLALLVVVGHLTLPFFSIAWPPLLSIADAAVPGFFVLSGFMIRYVTQDRERDPRRYFISRASRMYSVLLPTVVLTLVCNRIVFHVDPAYGHLQFADTAATATAAHVLAHLLFFTQFWGHAVLLAPNLPLWSLGYEVPYYIFFGLLCLCRGSARWLAAAVYALLLGPQVLFLAPLWWSGCWLYDAWQWSRNTSAHRARTALVGMFCLTAVLLLLWPIHGGNLASVLQQLPNPLTLLHQPASRATLHAYAAGIVAWALMFLGLAASDLVTLPKKAPWTRPVRRIADGTFTLYLFHYPLFCAARALLGNNFSNRATWFALLLVTMVCVLAAIPIDHLKRALRTRFHSWSHAGSREGA